MSQRSGAALLCRRPTVSFCLVIRRKRTRELSTQSPLQARTASKVPGSDVPRVLYKDSLARRRFTEVARMAQIHARQARQAFAILRCPALHQAKSLDHVTQPVREAVSELELQDDAIAKRSARVAHGSAKRSFGSDFGKNVTIQSHPHRVAHGVHVSFPLVANVRLGNSMNLRGQ